MERNYLILISEYLHIIVNVDVLITFNFRLLYGPKINIEEEDIKKGSVPEWKLQPKVSYDDDEGDD